MSLKLTKIGIICGLGCGGYGGYEALSDSTPPLNCAWSEASERFVMTDALTGNTYDAQIGGLRLRPFSDYICYAKTASGTITAPAPIR